MMQPCVVVATHDDSWCDDIRPDREGTLDLVMFQPAGDASAMLVVRCIEPPLD
jgi:hypothetical protein